MSKRKKSPEIPPEQLLYRMEPILTILEAALYSAFVKDCRRVSVCLIAPPEAGKTQAMLHFEKFPGVKVFSDVTAKPLEDLRPQIQENKITHLILTDLVAISAHNKRTSALLYSRLSAFMEEGMRSTADAGGIKEWTDKEGQAPTLGLIAGITTELMKDQRSYWHKTGFLSRFVPICYGHSAETQTQVRDRMLGTKKRSNSVDIEPLKKMVEVTITDDHREEIKRLAQIYSTINKTYGYRFVGQLAGLMRGRALSKGRTITTDEDVEFLWYVNQYANPNNPPQI